MDFNEKNIPDFDAYLNGEMDNEAKLSFETRLQNDPEFKSEFEGFKQFEETMANVEIKAFKENLKNWDEPVATPDKKKNIINMRVWLSVAALLVIGLIAINFLRSGPDNQELAATYFSPYENIITIRGEKEDLDDALLLYESGEYEKANAIFTAYPDNEIAQFYAGESFMAQKDYEAAVAKFVKLTNEENLFSEIAAYHLSLAYVGLDKIGEAIEVLEKIAPADDYYSEAQLLLKDLK